MYKLIYLFNSDKLWLLLNPMETPLMSILNCLLKQQYFVDYLLWYERLYTISMSYKIRNILYQLMF